MQSPSTRESWLHQCALGLRPLFQRAGVDLPAKYRLTTSLTGKRKVIGVCFDKSASRDGVHEILIRLDQDDPLQVTAILAHELIHAIVGCKAGHGAPFRRVAKAMGLGGKMRATVPSAAFKADVAPLLSALGPFPHAALTLGGDGDPRKKDSTRLLKVACSDSSCGLSYRITSKWIDAVTAADQVFGCPLCSAVMNVG